MDVAGRYGSSSSKLVGHRMFGRSCWLSRASSQADRLSNGSDIAAQLGAGRSDGCYFASGLNLVTTEPEQGTGNTPITESSRHHRHGVGRGVASGAALVFGRIAVWQRW